jgi:hypothetical protein
VLLEGIAAQLKRPTLKSLEPDAKSPAHGRASRFQGRADHLISSAAWEFGLDFDYSKLFKTSISSTNAEQVLNVGASTCYTAVKRPELRPI